MFKCIYKYNLNQTLYVFLVLIRYSTQIYFSIMITMQLDFLIFTFYAIHIPYCI